MKHAYLAFPIMLASCALADALGGSAAKGDGGVTGADSGASHVDGAVGEAEDASSADASAADAASGDAGSALAPSCQGLPSACGSAGSDDCCANALVPGGTYLRSYDEASGAHDDDSFPATISDFRLDTYEITVGRFRAFVEAGMGTQEEPPAAESGAHAAIDGSGWSSTWNDDLEEDEAALRAALDCDAVDPTWTDSPGENEQRPMNCITWYEAMAFCIWDGGYLPTEAEWNYAATGGDLQRAYPWSDPPESTTLDSTYAVYLGSDGATKDVGSRSPRGDGRWAHADLAGNVFEWTLDWHGTYPSPCTDCALLEATSARVVRGGYFASDAGTLRTAQRNFSEPFNRGSDKGARCARAP